VLTVAELLLVAGVREDSMLRPTGAVLVASVAIGSRVKRTSLVVEASM